MWTDLQNESLAVVCIEIEKGTNMLDDNLYAYLLDMAKDGLWDMILAGPPCRTVSLQRYREDGGPRPLRAREGVSRFGLSWNSARQQEECNQDSLLWLRTLFLMYTGKIGNPHLETLLEQPADPETWVSPTRQRPFHGFASYLAWPETGRVGNILQMKEVTLDQGALGHSKVKPTTLMTDIAEVLPLHGMKADRGQCASWSDDLETRLQEAREAAEWSPGLVQVLQTAIRRKQQSAVYAPRRGQVMRNPEKWRGFLEQQRRGRERLGLPPRPDEYLALRAVNQQLDEWKRHILNEHQPARRDCAECLRAMGRSRPHHRNAHASAYSLNIDVAGPYPAGHDQAGVAPRYFMVGVYTLPVKVWYGFGGVTSRSWRTST